MVPAPSPLPARFPCWCRAIYSWGGESKRDLGFIEGDLIECLNAGDGSWWVGRLYRDRRTIGSFPSNFVQLLADDFRPTARSASPLPAINSSSQHDLPAKSKTFRKPFEAYVKAPHYTSAKQPEKFREPPNQRSRELSVDTAPRSALDYAERASTPASYHASHSRAPSPVPSSVPSLPRHGHTPEPVFYSREQEESPLPPPPPPHRHISRREPMHIHASSLDEARQNSPVSFRNNRPTTANSTEIVNEVPRQRSYTAQSGLLDEHRPQTPYSPASGRSSPGQLHLTPSPLREAMDGVMEQLDQLEGIGGPWDAASPEHTQPLDPWSPESFDMLSHASPRPTLKARSIRRPMTAMGVAHQDEGYETWSGESSQAASQHAIERQRAMGAPKLSNYVEKMERRLQNMHHHSTSLPVNPPGDMGPPPAPKLRSARSDAPLEGMVSEPRLRSQKSAYDMRHGVSRTCTTKTSVTTASSGNQSNTSSSTQSNGKTLWSGASAGAFSSTSAGSLARTTHRAYSALGVREMNIVERLETPFTGVTYHSSHASVARSAARPGAQMGFQDEVAAGLGGLVQPKPPKRSIFKKIFESAKMGVASSRNNIATSSGSGLASTAISSSDRSVHHGPPSMSTSLVTLGMLSSGRDSQRETGLGSGVDWVQVRRDVHRSNSLSKIEKGERRDRCQMMDHPAFNPVDALYESIEGDEGADGQPLPDPLNYESINFSHVDKHSRFISDPPPLTTAITLATSYLSRPYRSDVQRLRAIFTWVAEKICWEEDFEGSIDSRRVIQTKRACAEEYAVLVKDMCLAIGLQCEVVRGYLKTPGEAVDATTMPRPNHWWNAVVIDDEWRIVDCCLATPSNPKRSLFSSTNSTTADFWWFLTRPTEACWIHVPERIEQQRIVPPVAHEVLVNLPCACPPFFRNGLEMVDFNTSATRMEDLEMVHIKINVPADIEVAAEVEARAFSRDVDGDVFESGETVKKRALAQAEWFNGVKRYTIKGLLPGDEGLGTLKVYAGKRGLMHSIKDIPHPLAFALPIFHSGENPPYDFVTRHPTPHAQRNDIYVVQPQCQRLALNNTFVFAIRQHPSSLSSGPQSSLTPASNPGMTSPLPSTRPGSSQGMMDSSVNGSNPSSASGSVAGQKPAKLAIQTPGGKILRLMRKEDRGGISNASKAGRTGDEVSDGGTWETIIKCSERGVWRGLVLADRTARWCVFAEWVCVG